MMSFYKDLFVAGNLSGIDDCCIFLKRSLTPDWITELFRPFMEEDVIIALKDVSPNKTSGSHGFIVIFYQKY